MRRRKQLFWAWWGWEPMSYYRRPGAPIASVADDQRVPLEEWHRLLQSEETVVAAAGIGVNCIVTHFIKGFGLAHECEEMAETARLTEICHRHGITVFGYTQFGTIFPTTFFEENPEARHWIQLNEDGSPALWNGCADRYLPCPLSDGYMRHMKKCIDAGLAHGLDGLHFDNFQFRPCYCPRCRETYRREVGAELPTADVLEHTPYAPEVRRWTQWRCDKLTHCMRELGDHARAGRPDVRLIWNNMPINGTRDRRLWNGADFYEQGRNADLLWSENTHFPCVLDGVPIHQVNDFKTAEAMGYGTFSTSWKSQYTASALPHEPGEVALLSAETTAWVASPGNNWLMRREYLRQLPDGVLCREWSRQMSYVHAHEQLFYSSRGCGEVALYLDRRRTNEDFPRNYGGFLSLQQLLLQKHIGYDLVFSGQEERLSSYPVVLSLFPLALGEAFEQAHTVLTYAPDTLAVNLDSYFKDYKVPLPARADELARQIRQTLGERELELLDAPETVLMERRLADDGHHLLHLVNYDHRALTHGVRVRFRVPPREVVVMSVDDGVRRLSPVGNELSLPTWGIWLTLVW